jgi:hypothetical protein
MDIFTVFLGLGGSIGGLILFLAMVFDSPPKGWVSEEQKAQRALDKEKDRYVKAKLLELEKEGFFKNRPM